MTFAIKNKSIHKTGRAMEYKHYIPDKKIGAVLVMISGGGHTAKTWEETPDGRPGWAPLFAEHGREVVVVNWASGLETLTQRENMSLIKDVIEKEVPDKNRRIVFMAWSMGGPQAFVLATDIMKERVAGIVGYGTTGPLNFYEPENASWNPVDTEPRILSEEKINRITDSPLFPKDYMERYKKEYLIPLPPRAVAIQAKHPSMKSEWDSLTVKNTDAIPPVFIINGTHDIRRSKDNIAPFEQWLTHYQKDVHFEYVNDFPHVGMLCHGNEKIVSRYVAWLTKRGL